MALTIETQGHRMPEQNPMFRVFDEARAIATKKNSDYANSADVFKNFRMCEQMGLPAYEGVMVRMSDKFMRVMNLIAKQREGRAPAVADESLRDTMVDIVNYSAIMVALYDEYCADQSVMAGIQESFNGR